MFFYYAIDNVYNNALCEILHKALPNFESETSTTKLAFGDFVIKPMVNSRERYGVWFDGKFIMSIQDEFGHMFSAIVKKNSYITKNMVEIVLACMIAGFHEYRTNNPEPITVKEDVIKLVDSMMAKHSHKFNVDEMSEMSEMLYGKKNERQMSAFRDDF